MSLSVKTQGGGGFFPSIFVTGLSETDTVYATMGSKTMYGKWETRTVDETEVSGFLISPLRELGVWTVTATNGEKTATQDVLIDVATEYEVEMNLANYMMLYYFGDECEEITGGWKEGYKEGGGYITKGENSLIVATNYTTAARVTAQTANKLSADNSTKMLFKISSTSQNNYAGATATDGDNPSENTLWVNTSGAMSESVVLANVSLVGEYYFAFMQNWSGKTSLTLYAAALCEADDWTTLCDMAGVSAPADLASLIADTASITAILASEDAVKYMAANCTGDFMASFVTSSACCSALDSSPHKAIVSANCHWAKFLAMAQ